MQEKKVKKTNKKLLSKEEEIELGKKIANGNISAKRRLINCNQALVVSIANEYVGSMSDIKELISHGNLGLMRAAEDWDYTKGTRFSTYATYWIKDEIFNYLELNHFIKIPQKVYNRYKKLKNYEDQYFVTYGKQPSVKQLAEFSKEFSEEEIVDIRSIVPTDISLNTTIDDNGEVEILDTIQGDDMNVIEELDEEIQNNVLLEALNQLTENERKVYMLRNGLGVEEEMTLEEVGKVLGVCKQRIAQIEHRANNKVEAYIKSSKKLK